MVVLQVVQVLICLLNNNITIYHHASHTLKKDFAIICYFNRGWQFILSRAF
uniref:Uncharacterized protein n=1 Tax=uncultured marine virus TaxID=186617 RepID=A0A0F7LCE0_9VIRU|nr:hypothetical protein [uncultured marine virus]